MRVASEKMISRLSGEGFLPLRLIEPIWGFNKKPIPSTVTKALRTEVKSAIYVNSADDVVCFYCEGNADGSVVFRMKFFNSETRALFEADYVCEKRRIGKEYRVKLRKKEERKKTLSGYLSYMLAESEKIFGVVKQRCGYANIRTSDVTCTGFRTVTSYMGNGKYMILLFVVDIDGRDPAKCELNWNSTKRVDPVISKAFSELQKMVDHYNTLLEKHLTEKMIAVIQSSPKVDITQS